LAIIFKATQAYSLAPKGCYGNEGVVFNVIQIKTDFTPARVFLYEKMAE
jgi:hypothetical protein